MATYFHNHGHANANTEMQGNGDALQTLILMNPANYVAYTDNNHHLPPPPPTNFMFLNNSTSSHIHHFNGIPLQAAAASPQHQDASDDLPRFHYNLYNPLANGGEAREVTRAKQGLSLSLSSQQPPGHAPSQAPETAVPEARVFGGEPDNVVLSCKYLKAAQQLLDEVVSIGKEGKSSGGELTKDEHKNSAEEAGDGGAKRAADLTTAEKQEAQLKKSKLVGMLDEVEQRYKQYEQQMHMVTSWFEEAAGVGSAKAYTALALQTISKQFRCLKDAIMAQIGAASRSLGDEDKKVEGSSRLKYIDNQIRQQRALQQQFGIIQNNAWRPQRGLPERSVSVLRAWLFQHFLHPYPKDTDKIMLAKQAGLTRSQVSNWFINARVRLWKPMVEEMYSEEIKGKQINGSIEDETAKTEEKQQVSTSNKSEMDSIRNSKKPRNAPSTIVQAEASSVEEKQQISMRFGFDERQSREGFTITGAPANFFGTYPIMGVEQFQPPYSSNGVSLTLGLQHCDNISNQNRSVDGEEGNDFDTFNAHNTTTLGVYDNIDVQKTRQQDLVYNY